MHLPELITDLAIILLTGGVVTVLFKKLNQPLVLGYIAAGFLIGPYMPLFFTVADAEAISTWSEIGIIILMFCLGLEFNLHKLMRVGGTAFITALTEVLGMLLLGYAVGRAMGWASMDSVFLGGMLSMSSTTIIIKAFDELGVSKENYAQLVFGTLVVEDIAGIFMMIILSTVSVSQSVSGPALAMKLGLLVLYLAVWLLLGIYLLPTLLKKTVDFMNDETLLVVSLGLCFGMVLLADALGFSSALGAFLSGSLLAGTVHSERIEHLTSGVKDLFGAVFFISVGMMLDPAMVLKYILPILIISLTTIVGKLLFSSLGVLFSGQPLRNAVHCGCSLAQIGEFAFIIASLGLSLGVIEEYVYPVIVSVSVITTLTTPFFIRTAEKIYQGLCRLLPDKLLSRLDRYTENPADGAEPAGDWSAYLKRYFKVTALYGVVLAGIHILGSFLLLPLLQRLPWPDRMAEILSLIIVWSAMSLFIRPLLDKNNPLFTVLWLQKRSNRLPLLALTAIRLLLAVFLAFLPLRTIFSVDSLWLLPLIALALVVLSRSNRLSSAYLRVEARFLMNYNERELSGAGEDILRLDEELRLLTYTYPDNSHANLIALDWGRRFGVNVIKATRGRHHYNMPSGSFVPQKGDSLLVLGGVENLRAFSLEVGLDPSAPHGSLRDFIQSERDPETDLYSYALPVRENSSLNGSTVRNSGLRDNYDCMVLGVQRSGLSILLPDPNTALLPGDYIWILGTASMADKLLLDT